MQEERDFVIKNSQARVEMTLEGIGKKLSGFHENKNYQLCLKLLLLYSLKVDRLADAATKSREIGEIVSLLKDPHFFKEVIYCSKELFATLKGDDLKKAETDCLGLLGLVAGWFVAEEMKPHRGLLQDSLLNSIADLVATDFQDVPQSLVYLKRGKRTVASDNLKSLVFQLLVLKSGRRLGTEALCSLLGLAKRCILENPASSTCRSLYNDILLYSGSFGGLIFPYNEDGKSMPALFGCDLRLFDMFKANKLPCPTYHARTTAAKVAILQRPDLPFMKKTAEFLMLNEKAKVQKKSLDSERVAAFCRKEKNRLLNSVFGKKDAGSPPSRSRRKRALPHQQALGGNPQQVLRGPAGAEADRRHRQHALPAAALEPAAVAPEAAARQARPGPEQNSSRGLSRSWATRASTRSTTSPSCTSCTSRRTSKSSRAGSRSSPTCASAPRQSSSSTTVCC